MKNNSAVSVNLSVGSDVIRQHEKLIRHLAKAFGRPDIFEDLMQEGRISLAQAAKSWSPDFAGHEGKKTSIWTYARRSVIRDMMRYKTQETSRSVGLDDVSEGFEGVDYSNPESEYEVAELDRIVDRACLLLDPEEVAVLRSIVIEEKDIRAIAAERGEAKSTTSDIKQRAIAKLRGYVEAAQ